jgi:hypothetical protein
MQSNSESGYENLNQSYNFSRHQMIDTTVSSLNEDIIIIKENDNNNVTELAILNENIDNIDNMKIENDNFFDKNTKINNNTNKNQNSNQIDYCNFNEDRVINKRRFGKTFTFLFKNGEPMIVIGPHCKNKELINLIKSNKLNQNKIL